MNNNLKKILIATGGTGGHIFPALSLANHFAEKKKIVEIISDKRGINFLKNSTKIKVITTISSILFKDNLIKLLLSLLTNVFGLIHSFFYLIFNRPNIVFGMGGYSSFPTCAAAIILKIPVILYENNLHIGKSNRYLLPFVKKIFVSYQELEGISAKHKIKIVKIGNIIRSEILNMKTVNKFNYNEENLNILILGGSQAAQIFGDKIPLIIEKCVKSKIQLKIFQQCLPKQSEFLNNFYRKLNIEFEVFNFTTNVTHYFLKSNLAITRSGSSMLAELTNAKIPFISIPLPSSADNHQLKNATFYANKGFSYLIEEKDLESKLFNLIEKLNQDTSLLDQIKTKQGQYSDKTVFKNIDEEINKFTNEKY